MKIDQHLSELQKKAKGVVFYETPCSYHMQIAVPLRGDEV